MPRQPDERVAELEERLAERERQLAAIAPAAPATLDNAGQEQVVQALEATWPHLDAVKFIVKLEKRFAGAIPEGVGAALRAWAWFAAQSPALGGQSGGEPADGTHNAYLLRAALVETSKGSALVTEWQTMDEPRYYWTTW